MGKGHKPPQSMIPGGQQHQRQQVQTVTTIERHAVALRGPLPPPQILEEYNRVQPGLGDKIVQWAEEETAYRRESYNHEAQMAALELSRNHLRLVLSLILAFLVVLIFAVVAVFAIANGHGVAGVAVLVAEMTALVLAFLKKNSKRPEEKK